MSVPFYTAVNQPHPGNPPEQGNTGLWFTRFYNQFGSDWSVADGGKRSWIGTVTGLRGDLRALKDAASRFECLGLTLGAKVVDFNTEGNLVTGLGLSHPIENGFTWHHTLGVPYLPASGVKGLLRGWVEAWTDDVDDDQRTVLIQRWFGTAKGSDAPQDRVGGLIFFDALPITPVSLVEEVMAPHMGKWYEQGGQIKLEADYADKAPADWHSPVPIPFLAVGRGASFRFMVAPRLTGDAGADQQARQDSKDAMAQLTLALEWMGAGAKTATGYGRMLPDGAKIAAALAEAGIETGSAQWIGAKVTRNKSTGELSVTSAEGQRAAPVKSSQAQDIFNRLSEAAQKKLRDGKKPLVMTAEVETIGNLTHVVSLLPSVDI